MTIFKEKVRCQCFFSSFFLLQNHYNNYNLKNGITSYIDNELIKQDLITFRDFVVVVAVIM